MKTHKKFEFTGRASGGNHDWTKLLDGGIYELTEGEDYTCKTITLCSMGRAQAKKLGKTLKTQKVEGGVVIQAVDAE